MTHRSAVSDCQKIVVIEQHVHEVLAPADADRRRPGRCSAFPS